MAAIFKLATKYIKSKRSVKSGAITPKVPFEILKSFMSRQVYSIVEQIERLDETDRRLLDLKLPEMADAQWRRESELARAVASQRGIGQQAIDKAVEELRNHP